MLFYGMLAISYDVEDRVNASFSDNRNVDPLAVITRAWPPTRRGNPTRTGTEFESRSLDKSKGIT